MIRLGVIGTGKIAGEFIAAARKSGYFEIAALYSRTAEKGNEFAREHDIACVMTDMGKMLSCDKFGCLYIAVPNSLHCAQALRALEHGKHVILEKPFCTTLDEAESLFRTAEERGCFLLEAISILPRPVFAQVREWLPLISPVRQAFFNYSQYSSRYDAYLKGEAANVFRTEFSGGALRDINIYNLHAMTALFGVPRKGVYMPRIGFNGVDCSGTALFDYEGMQAVCMGAKDCDGDEMALIEGEKGWIDVREAGHMWSGAELHLRDGRTVKTVHDAEKDRLLDECRAFGRILKEHDRERYCELKRETLMTMETLMKVIG